MDMVGFWWVEISWSSWDKQETSTTRDARDKWRRSLDKERVESEEERAGVKVERENGRRPLFLSKQAARIRRLLRGDKPEGLTDGGGDRLCRPP